MKEYRSFVGVSLPIRVLEKIDTFKERHGKRNRTDALIQLLELSFMVESKIGEVEAWTSQDLEDIRSQFESGELVDWVMKLDPRKLDTFLSILLNEQKDRGMKQKKLNVTIQREA